MAAQKHKVPQELRDPFGRVRAECANLRKQIRTSGLGKLSDKNKKFLRLVVQAAELAPPLDKSDDGGDDALADVLEWNEADVAGGK